MDNIENKYPVIYFDVKQLDGDKTMMLIKPLTDYFRREKVPFVVLPNSTSLVFLDKKDLLKCLYATIEEVESWD